MRHIISKAAVGDFTADCSGHIRPAGSHRRDRFPGQRGTILRGKAAECPADKADASARTHPGASVHNCIPNIAVALEFTGKACCKSTGRRAACTRCRTSSPKYASGAFCSTANTADDFCSHHHLHSHAGTGLRHVEPHRCQIAVNPLGRLQKCKRTEQPQEYTAVPCGKRAAIPDKLTHGGIESAQKPYVHHKQQQLRTDHPAPAPKNRCRSFGGPDRESKRRSIAENANHNVPLYSFQQQLEIVPAQGDLQNDHQKQSDHRYNRYDRHQSVQQRLLDAGKRKIFSCHTDFHQRRIGCPCNGESQREDRLCISNEQCKQRASHQQYPRIFRLGDGPAKGPEQLPDGDQEQNGPCSVLQHRKRFCHKGEIFLHRGHIRPQCLKEQPRHCIHHLGYDSGDPCDDPLKNPVKHFRSPPIRLTGVDHPL